MNQVIWMFSGQGSQYFDMGKDLYEADPVFRDIMRSCDAHCERLLGYSLLEIIYPRSPKSHTELFDNLLHTHPALFCIQYSLARTLLSQGMKPDLLLGYSLGEFVALTVAGALPFPVALEWIIQQAELLTQRAPSGAMLAVMAPEQILEPSDLDQDTCIAAYNMPNHFVLSGSKASIERVRTHLRALEIPHQLLPVNFAFHSPAIAQVEPAYRQQIGTLRPAPLVIPLLSLSHTQTLHALPADFFWNVLRQPVRFEATIRQLAPGSHFRFVDLGPSGTLATFLKYILKPPSQEAIYPILTPFRQAETNLQRLYHEM